MKTSVNLARRLFVVIDGNTMNPATDKGASQAPKSMLSRLEPENQLIRVHSLQIGKSLLTHVIAPEHAAAQPPIISANSTCQVE